MAAAAGEADPAAAPPPAVVSAEWLSAALRDKQTPVRVLDASWYLPAMGALECT
jgi:3-mercaptopyruvate sulfurtransferase SseA